MSEKLSGCKVLAKSLVAKGVKVMFGIVGIPVMEVAQACIDEGIQFIGCRNEQSASYAAGAYGYMNKVPGVCLTVSGPGVVNALSGLFNAQSNCWPLILIGGSCDDDKIGLGGFQELDQIKACKVYSKYSFKPKMIDDIPYGLHQCFIQALNGRPGPTYFDFPANLILSETNNLNLNYPILNLPIYPLISSNQILNLIDLLLSSKSPLIIIGKGAAYSQCEIQLLKLIELINIPILPSPMAKGLISDTHPNCVGMSRNDAIKSADLVLLLGVRLNWMFKFGNQFKNNCKLIQVDIDTNENNKSRLIDLFIQSDINQLLIKLNEKLKDLKNLNLIKEINQINLNNLNEVKLKNQKKLLNYFNEKDEFLNHYQAIKEIDQCIKNYNKDICLISEGARTMDVTRMLVNSNQPRKRLDAGTLGVMGVGLGYAMAAQLSYPTNKIVCIMGDSAFGFSGLEIETLARFSLPITIIIVNNSGIYSGEPTLSPFTTKTIPSHTLSPDTQYQNLASILPNNVKGFYADSIQSINENVKNALDYNGVSLVNIKIDTKPDSKGFYWLNETKEVKSKL